MHKIEWDNYLKTDRDRKSTRAKGVDFRTDFESDFGRVVFSSAIRRMHDKTQVMPLTSGDSMHTRLTHSMEVMSIAYSLGIGLCRNEEFKTAYGEKASDYERDIPMILKTAALIHDIGNPPFGHFGETIIQKYFRNYFEKVGQLNEASQMLDFTEFDGNAQGFRLLTKLQYLNDLNGLNLTFPILGAYMKYPNIGARSKKDYIGKKKHGVYTSEKEVFNKIVKECGLNHGKYIKRHPLSFLVEAADSICYNIMDIEDGLERKWYSFEDVISFIEKAIKKETNNDNLRLSDIIKSKCYDEDESEKVRMVHFRISVINYFVNLANKNYIDNLEQIDKGNYSKELIEDDPNKLSIAFQQFAQRYIYTQKEIQNIELTGETVLHGLFDLIIGYVFNPDENYRKRAKSVISRTCLRVAYHENNKEVMDVETFFNYDLDKLDTYSKLRMIVDFISGMTDKYALSLFRKLSGQQL